MQNTNTSLNSLDIQTIRSQFPVLSREVRGKKLVYLDNAATTQKPISVIASITDYYTSYNSNIHRGVHLLSQQATDAYEQAREKVRKFIGAESDKEVIFTKGTTEAINLVVATYGRKFLHAGDVVLISGMEHHSNIVPWQILAEEKGIVINVIPVLDNGELDMEAYYRLLTPDVRFVSVVHVSNTLGTINPVNEIVTSAHSIGAKVLLDGAQAIQHLKVNVKELDADFFVFSGHKLYAPTGIGILYGKEELLKSMPPYMGGGDMIASVTFEKTIYNTLPYKFEAGTPNIEGGIGLGYAIDFIESLGIEAIANYEAELLEYANEVLCPIPGLRPIGTAKEKCSVFSFVLENIHPHDIGTILDVEGIAVRTGHLCTQPLMKRFGVPAVARASFSFYNTKEEIDALHTGINKVFEVFG